MHCDACGHDQPAGRFCGHCGALVGEEVAGPPEAPSPAGNGRVLRWTMGLLAVVAVVAVTVLLGGRGPGSDPSGPVAVPTDVATSPPSPAVTEGPPLRGPVFRNETGSTLLFDDGFSGIVALDLDTSQVVAFALPGQAPGDQPYRLLRSGLELVVGWDGVSVTVPGQEDPSRELGDDATIFLPAADSDHVWLITWEGGQVGVGRSTWELVDMGGRVLHRVAGVEGLQPLRGVPEGLALRNAADRLVVFDVTVGALVDGVGVERAVIGDATTDRVAWCDAPCREAHITGPDEAVVSLDDEEVDRFLVGRGTARFSPDGRLIAVPARVTVDEGRAVDFQVRVHDTASGRLVASTSVPLGEPRPVWSDDGDQLFFTVAFGTDPVPEGPYMLGRWTETAGFELIDADPFNLPRGSFVTYPSEAAADWF